MRNIKVIDGEIDLSVEEHNKINNWAEERNCKVMWGLLSNGYCKDKEEIDILTCVSKNGIHLYPMSYIDIEESKMNNQNYGIYTEPIDETGDGQLCDIEVDEEQYNTWVNNCKKNKTKSSWIYFKDLDNTPRRKVKYDEENDVLTYNGLHKYQWGFIICKNVPNSS